MGRKKLKRPPLEQLFSKAMSMLVPSHVEDHFEMWDAREYKDRWVIEMREKAGKIPTELSGNDDIVFDSYCNPLETSSHSFVSLSTFACFVVVTSVQGVTVITPIITM